MLHSIVDLKLKNYEKMKEKKLPAKWHKKRHLVKKKPQQSDRLYSQSLWKADPSIDRY